MTTTAPAPTDREVRRDTLATRIADLTARRDQLDRDATTARTTLERERNTLGALIAEGRGPEVTDPVRARIRELAESVEGLTRAGDVVRRQVADVEGQRDAITIDVEADHLVDAKRVIGAAERAMEALVRDAATRLYDLDQELRTARMQANGAWARLRDANRKAGQAFDTSPMSNPATHGISIPGLGDLVEHVLKFRTNQTSAQMTAAIGQGVRDTLRMVARSGQ